LDQPLRPPTVAHGLPGQLHGTFERRITDELPRPHVRAEFVLSHDVITLLEEILEHVKDFGREPDGRPRAVEGIELSIEDTVGKDIPHTYPSLRRASRLGVSRGHA
jgi:hypothetical protein